MAVAFVRSVVASDYDNAAPTVTSSSSGTLPTPATAGNALIAVFGIDKAAGTFTVPSGWTQLAQVSGASVSLFVIGKIAAGGETSVTVTYSTPAFGGTTLLAEYSGVSGFGPVSAPAYSDTARTSMALGPVTSTAAGRALAFLTMDSMDTVDPAASFTPAATGWTTRLVATSPTSTNGAPGIALDELTAAVASGATVPSTTFTWTRSDQVAGALVLLNEGTAPPPSSLDKLRLGTGTVGLRVGASAASRAYIGATQVWP